MVAKRPPWSHVYAAHFRHDLLHFTINHRSVAVLDQGVILGDRHSRERGLPDRILPHGDRGDFEDRRLLRFAVAAWILAVRSVGDSFAGNRHAFDHYLGKSRSSHIDGFAFGQFNSRTAQPAGDMKLVDAEWNPRLRANDD